MKDRHLFIIAAMAVAVVAAPAALARDGAGPVTARPIVSGPERVVPKPDRPGPNINEHLRKLNARAKAAVAGGADPAQVRKALQAHKQKLRRRAAAAN